MGAAWVCAGAIVGTRDASSLACAYAPVADFAGHLQHATGAQRFACALMFRRVPRPRCASSDSVLATALACNDSQAVFSDQFTHTVDKPENAAESAAG